MGWSDQIVAGMQEYHKKHVAYDQAEQLATALSRIGINEAGQLTRADMGDGKKASGVVPIIDPKALELFKARTGKERERATGSMEALSRIGMNLISRQAGREPRVPVQAGGRTFNVSEPAALSATMQGERMERSDRAAAATGARLARGEKRDERRLQLSESGARQKKLENSPEIKFFKDTGLSPQALIGAIDEGYEAVDSGTGKKVADVGPLEPGKTLKDYRDKPGFWKQVGSYIPDFGVLGLDVPPEGRPVQFNPKGKAFRETEYVYPGNAKEGRPKITKVSPHPEGEFLRIGEKRIPYQEAARMRGIAETRRAEALDALKRNPLLLPAIKERLANWGYDPDDQFWGLPLPQE